MRVLVYECVSAGGLGPNVPDSLLREGKAMLAAASEDFRRLPGVDVRTLTDETPEKFARLAASSDWTMLIAPEFDDLLLSRSRWTLEAGGRLLGPSPDAIRLTGDKLALAEFWRSRKVRTPRTIESSHVSASNLAAPWVLKPRFGAGSQATFYVTQPGEFERSWKLANREFPGHEFIVQEFAAGQAASAALLIGETQTIPLLPARQHLSRDGRFHYEGGSLTLPGPLAERAVCLAVQAVAGITGLKGYVGVDLVLGEDGIDHAIEINPRLTTSYLGLRALCRDNLAEAMLRLAQGENVAPLRWSDGAVRFGFDSEEQNC